MSDAYDDYESKIQLAEHAWEQALEEKQEPVAWTQQIWRQFRPDGTLEFQKIRRTPNGEWEDYTAAQRREWVGLTDEEREFLLHQALKFYDTNAQLLSFIKTVEAKLKEKNT